MCKEWRNPPVFIPTGFHGGNTTHLFSPQGKKTYATYVYLIKNDVFSHE
jgi:hypothetical protein